MKGIEIELSLDVAKNLFDGPFSNDMTKKAPGGVTLEYQVQPMFVPRKQEPTPILYVALTVSKDVDSKAFSSWLSDKIKKSRTAPESIKINRRSIETTPDGIQKVIDESIKG
jgi:hypothetical protein